MKESVKNFEQSDLESELEKILEVLLCAKENFKEADLSFHRFLDLDPEVKERYKIFAQRWEETAVSLDEGTRFPEPDKGRESDLRKRERKKEAVVLKNR